MSPGRQAAGSAGLTWKPSLQAHVKVPVGSGRHSSAHPPLLLPQEFSSARRFNQFHIIIIMHACTPDGKWGGWRYGAEERETGRGGGGGGGAE